MSELTGAALWNATTQGYNDPEKSMRFDAPNHRTVECDTNNWKNLSLENLKALASRIREKEFILIGVRLERSPAGGSCSKSAKQSCKYARLRVGRGGVLANGKKSQYVGVADIPRIESAIERGKKLEEIERAIAVMIARNG